ncbi:hypothetical protein H0H93_003070 [Arthromyces matolae]|nr:hypothetical protein H0H93_003070 [Arthromyces matolae]
MHPDSPRVLEALVRAEKLFTQCLTAEERSRIHTVRDLRALVDQTKKFADELQSKDDQKGAFGFRKVGKKAILLEPLERLVEGAAKTSPSGGSMIWGSILFTLEVE